MLIGLAGRRRSGKGTVAEILRKLNPDMKVVAFADVLKRELAKQYGIPLQHLYDPDHKEKYRALMQQHGTLRRQEDPNYFISKTFEYMDSFPLSHWIIEDLRMFSEMQAMLSRQGIILLIQADQAVRAARGAIKNEVIDSHESETEVSSLPAHVFIELGGTVIYNNKGLYELEMEVSRWILSQSLRKPSANK